MQEVEKKAKDVKSQIGVLSHTKMKTEENKRDAISPSIDGITLKSTS